MVTTVVPHGNAEESIGEMENDEMENGEMKYKIFSSIIYNSFFKAEINIKM